jgi:hypothetical protein
MDIVLDSGADTKKPAEAGFPLEQKPNRLR